MRIRRSAVRGDIAGRPARRRTGPGCAAALATALLLSGCARGGSAPASTPADPVRPEAPKAAALPPSPAERALANAMTSLGQGRLAEAAGSLEAALALGDGLPSARLEALGALAVLLARPDYEGRDVARSRLLFEELLASSPPEASASGARLILGLLDVEAECVRQIAELRGHAATAGAEAEDLRVELAQRETELRRIKEILLGRSGGS